MHNYFFFFKLYCHIPQIIITLLFQKHKSLENISLLRIARKYILTLSVL